MWGELDCVTKMVRICVGVCYLLKLDCGKMLGVSTSLNWVAMGYLRLIAVLCLQHCLGLGWSIIWLRQIWWYYQRVRPSASLCALENVLISTNLNWLAMRYLDRAWVRLMLSLEHCLGVGWSISWCWWVDWYYEGWRSGLACMYCWELGRGAPTWPWDTWIEWGWCCVWSIVWEWDGELAIVDAGTIKGWRSELACVLVYWKICWELGREALTWIGWPQDTWGWCCVWSVAWEWNGVLSDSDEQDGTIKGWGPVPACAYSRMCWEVIGWLWDTWSDRGWCCFWSIAWEWDRVLADWDELNGTIKGWVSGPACVYWTKSWDLPLDIRAWGNIIIELKAGCDSCCCILVLWFEFATEWWLWSFGGCVGYSCGAMRYLGGADGAGVTTQRWLSAKRI